MKKQLLFGSALLAAISAFSQAGSHKLAAKMGGIVPEKYAYNQIEPIQANTTPVKPSTTPANKSTQKVAASNWNAIGSSMNVFGVLVSESKPLQYDENLNAVSFVVRRGTGYNSFPAPASNAQSGNIIAMVSTNLGSTWDSTLMWNDNDAWARYPQGGIYNPLSNTNLSNAYIVGTGPVTTINSKWEGNWFASKKLDVFTNTVSAVPGATQYITSTGPTYTTGAKKVDFARLHFSITDDGFVRSLGTILNDANSTSAYGFRGARIVKGTFNSGGYFVWTSDSISLANTPVDYDAGSLSYNVIDGQVDMAWSESGEYGYVWFLGIRQGATKNNTGLQPIIWKTSDYGASWSLMPGMNFNDTVTFAPALKRIDRVQYPVADHSLTIPYFNSAEGMDGVVDKNNKLHIFTALWGTRKSHPDSVAYIWTYTNTIGDNEIYRYAHTPGRENYIYDFTETSTGWNVIVVDSMMSELASGTPNSIGYGDNPWNVYQNSKQRVDARLQVSRDASGNYIAYSWAESDVAFTSQGKRWNSIPDIHVRLRHADSANVFKQEYNITENKTGVKSAAYMHNMSPKFKLVSTAGNTISIGLPVKVTNSTPLLQEFENTHWYSTALLDFTVNAPTNTVSVADNGSLETGSSVLYPNPASSNVSLNIDMKNNADVNIVVMNTVGQVVRNLTTSAQAGSNNINIDINGLTNGVYIVNVKVGTASTTKKLVVE